MRLGAFLLMGAALAASSLAAQGHQALPWERLAPLDWQVGSGPGRAEAPSDPVPSSGPLQVRLAGDGTLSLLDARGIIRLKTGLPGRPLKAWRDGGVPLAPPFGTWLFPGDSPLSQGLGGFQWVAEDFRPFLRGLLWILEDGEAVLTVVHPATAQVLQLPLPPGRDLSLRFLPDRLEVGAGDVDRGAPRQWSIPWIGLLPRLAALGPQADHSKPGTALIPFPKD